MAKQPRLGAGASSGGLAELRHRLFVVALGLLIYRLGSYIPVPGLDPARLASIFGNHTGGAMGLFDIFSGGALTRMTIFALGVMPYISSSIIVQMFGSVFPQVKQLRKEGEAGKRTLAKWTRYGTLILATLQGIGLTVWLSHGGVAIDPDFTFYFVAVLTLVTGAMFLVWLGEQITERGIGNGISLLIFVSIASRFPDEAHQISQLVHDGQISYLSLILLIVLLVTVVGFVVFMERAQRRITIQYAKKQMGRKVMQGQTSYFPLKINMAGVIPPIFASALLMFPTSIATFFAKLKGMGWLNEVALKLGYGQPLYILIFAIAVIFFCFFYTALTFSPKETADNLKKSGAYIPGIRPGLKTAEYIDRVLTRLTMAGSIYLLLVSLLPQYFIVFWHVPVYFGGTSILIMVVVLMDFIAQIQAHIMSSQYASIMKNRGSGSNLSLI
jgi:preprotein translocase subunit SecY